ncbi:Hypothetical protein AA314_05814 [Archangium gephyra]|uniref:Uncharacterized protein n=1 Tax=Archangium gephyra TaxID=48 RepID=A0AAC8QAS4_9BACT|nr:Hypothetical protein AA314_05814 [Archangium gephyra]
MPGGSPELGRRGEHIARGGSLPWGDGAARVGLEFGGVEWRGIAPRPPLLGHGCSGLRRASLAGSGGGSMLACRV